jgi:hypothetical protein
VTGHGPSRYGGPKASEVREIDYPVPTDDEVQVWLQAAGLDCGVWHVMTGLPYMIRPVWQSLGLRKPKVAVRGMVGGGRDRTFWGVALKQILVVMAGREPN